MREIFFSILLVLSLHLNAGKDSCGVINTSFRSGETLTFKAYYTLAGIYVSAGEATLTVNLDKFNNRPVYHITGEGKTYGFYDGFFRVRDKYESVIDTVHGQRNDQNEVRKVPCFQGTATLDQRVRI